MHDESGSPPSPQARRPGHTRPEPRSAMLHDQPNYTRHIAAPISHSPTYLVYLLRRGQRLLRQHLEATALHDLQLSWTAYEILHRICQPQPTTLAQLATDTNATLTTVTDAATALNRRGHINRPAVLTADTLVQPSAAGRLVEHHSHQRLTRLNHVITGPTTSVAALHRIAAALAQPPTDRPDP